MPVQDNLRQFLNELRDDSGAAHQQSRKFMRRVVGTLFTKLVSPTPVKTGHARGNWIVGVRNPSEDEIPSSQSTELSESQVINNGLSRIDRALKPGVRQSPKTRLPTIFISNNVSYLDLLDQGSSTQAPDGWIENAFSEIEAEFGEV